jgi:hypothetical protein
MTARRSEKDIVMIFKEVKLDADIVVTIPDDGCRDAGFAVELSQAVSLMRIADHLDGQHWPREIIAHSASEGIISFHRVGNTNEYRSTTTTDRIYL